jgi:hypothetical protein
MKTLFFAGCFDTITYVQCAAWGYFPSNIIWSTTSIPLRAPLLGISSGDLRLGAGFGSALGANFGELELVLSQ